MPTYDKQTLELACPGCKKPLNLTYNDVCNKTEIKCTRCSSGYRFGSSSRNHLRNALSRMESAQKELSKAMGDLMKEREIFLKK